MKATLYLSEKNKENITKTPFLVVGNVQSGKTRFIMEETYKLLSGDFDVVIVISGTNNLLKEQTEERLIEKFKNINDFLFTSMSTSAFEVFPNDRKILFSVLKGTKQLNKLFQLVTESEQKNIAILDDESDFGSINIANDNQRSAIYDILHKIYERANHIFYYSITATPFADIMSEDSFEFQKLIKLTPSEGYTGLDFFNKLNSFYDDNIDMVEQAILEPNFQTLFLLLHDHIIRVIKCKENFSQLLINIDLKSSTFKVCQEAIKQSLYFMRTSLGGQDGKMISIIDELHENVSILDMKNKTYYSDKHSIVIGGQIISRGFTFSNPITTILSAWSNKIPADVLMQRARWFGYRKPLIAENMKLITSRNVIEAYKEAEILNNIIFSSNNVDEARKKIKEVKFGIIVPTMKVGKNNNKENYE